MNDYETSLQRVTIRLPGALLILWNAIASLSTPDASLMRCAMFKLYEKLSHVSHRNHAVLCGLSLVGPVFKRFYLGEGGADSTDEKQLLQKLLKRLLEMGAETVEVRKMFENALTTTTVEPVNDGKLDMELLDLLKVGMKSRWMDHFSLEGCSSLALREEGMKGLPFAGFTFMVRFASRLASLSCSNFPRYGCGYRIYQKRALGRCLARKRSLARLFNWY
jgi:hypothetical protein